MKRRRMKQKDKILMKIIIENRTTNSELLKQFHFIELLFFEQMGLNISLKRTISFSTSITE